MLTDVGHLAAIHKKTENRQWVGSKSEKESDSVRIHKLKSEMERKNRNRVTRVNIST